MADPTIDTMLRDIHDLLHEARSNCEVPLGDGVRLIERIGAARSSHQAGNLSSADLSKLVADVDGFIQEPIRRELEIDNPDAAVMQVRDILARLKNS